MKKIQIKNLITNVIIKEEEERMKQVKLDNKKTKVYISGFTDKLSIDRVKKYLLKSGWDAVTINNELMIVKHPYGDDIKLYNNAKLFLQNAFSSLADSIVVKKQ